MSDDMMTTRLTGELDDVLADLTERWCGGEGPGTDLAGFLGMGPDQYRAFCHGRDLPGHYEVPARPRRRPR